MQSVAKNQTSSSCCLAGTLTLALRLVTGWTYFSAFWRRLVLENKLNPDAPGYVGEKFNAPGGDTQIDVARSLLAQQ